MSSDRLWPMFHEADLAGLPEPSWLIGGHIPDGMTVIYGPPKLAKTFLALSVCLSLTSGRDWFGSASAGPAPVLYVSGEGAGGLYRRVEAWKARHAVGVTPLYVIPFGVRLTVREHVVGLYHDVHATAARLVVVDTLARSMAGSDENSAQDMGMVVQALDWLRAKTGCAVMVVHHSGVDGSRPRGSTALFGAADCLVRVAGNPDGTVDVSCDGQKDAPPFSRRRMQLEAAGRSAVLTEMAWSGNGRARADIYQ